MACTFSDDKVCYWCREDKLLLEQRTEMGKLLGIKIGNK